MASGRARYTGHIRRVGPGLGLGRGRWIGVRVYKCFVLPRLLAGRHLDGCCLCLATIGSMLATQPYKERELGADEDLRPKPPDIGQPSDTYVEQLKKENQAIYSEESMEEIIRITREASEEAERQMAQRLQQDALEEEDVYPLPSTGAVNDPIASHGSAFPSVLWANDWPFPWGFGSVRTICVSAWVVFLLLPTLFYFLVRDPIPPTSTFCARMTSKGLCRGAALFSRARPLRRLLTPLLRSPVPPCFVCALAMRSGLARPAERCERGLGDGVPCALHADWPLLRGHGLPEPRRAAAAQPGWDGRVPTSSRQRVFPLP